MATDAGKRPLGVLHGVSLTDAQRRSLQVLQDFDLTPGRDRLLRDGAMPAGWIDEALLEFRRYLALRALVPRSLMMLSKQVDDVWHTCLLFSRLYAALCQQAFGEFVHHDPATEADPDPAARWREFREAYATYFGEPGRLWQLVPALH